MSALDRLADFVGIETFYHDIWGNRRETSAATKRALVGAMGLPAASDAEAEASLRDVEQRAWRRPLPPVRVARDGQGIELPVSLPVGLDGAALSWVLEIEGSDAPHTGGQTVGSLPRSETAMLDGQGFERRILPPDVFAGRRRAITG